MSDPQRLRRLLQCDLLTCSRCGKRSAGPQLLPDLSICCRTCLPPHISPEPAVFLEALLQLLLCAEATPQPCDYCRFAGSPESKAACRCLQCGDNLCGGCAEAHRKTKVTRHHRICAFKEFASGELDADFRAGQKVACAEHDGEWLSRFCERCSRPVCARCVEEGAEHERHEGRALGPAGERSRERLAQLRDSLCSRQPAVEQLGNALSEHAESLEIQRQEAVEAIEAQTEALVARIAALKENLIEAVETTAAAEKEKVESKMAEVQAHAEEASRASKFVEAALEHSRDDELLTMSTVLDGRLEELLGTQFEELPEQHSVTFSPGDPNHLSALYGALKIESVPNSTANLPRGLHAAPIFASRDFKDGQLSKQPISNGRAKTDAKKVTCLFDPCPDSVDSEGGSRRHAPEAMAKLLPRSQLVAEFEATSPSDSRDIWPTGLAVHPQTGAIFVLDRDNKRVKVFDLSDGAARLKMEFGGPGSGDGFLLNPYDIAISRRGFLLVTDYHHEAYTTSPQVKMFDSGSGQFLRSFSEPGAFKHPRGIAMDPSGRDFAVADCRHRRVTVHNATDGRITGVITGDDELGGAIFSDPYYVTVTSKYDVVVTDWAAPNLKIFDAFGRLISQTGTYGTAQQEVLQPYGVCSDVHGNLLVADNTNHRVQLATPDGRFVKDVVSKAETLWHPMAMDIDLCGRLVVSEALGKIKVFKYQ